MFLCFAFDFIVCLFCNCLIGVLGYIVRVCEVWGCRWDLREVWGQAIGTWLKDLTDYVETMLQRQNGEQEQGTIQNNYVLLLVLLRCFLFFF